MFSTPGGQQQFIQQLARSYGGGGSYPNLPAMTPTAHSTGLNGSFSDPGQLTPYGAFHYPGEPQGDPGLNSGNVGAVAAGQTSNPGGSMQRPNDPRALLQAIIEHSFAPKIGIPDRVNPIQGMGPGNAHQMPWDMHHAQVSAASNLARLLAQQHTSGLRRFQYNGRH